MESRLEDKGSHFGYSTLVFWLQWEHLYSVSRALVYEKGCFFGTSLFPSFPFKLGKCAFQLGVRVCAIVKVMDF